MFRKLRTFNSLGRLGLLAWLPGKPRIGLHHAGPSCLATDDELLAMEGFDILGLWLGACSSAARLSSVHAGPQ